MASPKYPKPLAQILAETGHENDGLKARKQMRKDRKFFASPGFGGRYSLTKKQETRLLNELGWKRKPTRKPKPATKSVRREASVTVGEQA